MKKVTRTISLLLIGVMMFALTACGGNASPSPSGSTAPTPAASQPSNSPATSSTPAASQPVSGAKDTIIIATENETPSLTSVGHNAVAGSYMNQLTYNSLFRVNENMEVVVDLAESFETKSDTQWIIHLKKGVLFHNGDEMKAEDVKASLELCKVSPEVSQYGKSSGTVTVIDDYTIQLDTDGPQANLLMDLTHHGNNILPKKLIESGHDFNKEPIGTGAYKLVKWTLGDRLEFVSNDNYFDKEAMPQIKNMVWRIIPEGSSRTISLEAGEVDFVVEVEAMDVQKLQDNPATDVIAIAGTSHNFLMLNNELPNFSNQKFREALNAAIDKEAVVAVALNNFAVPAYSQTPMGFPGSTENGAVSTKRDIELAKKLLEESGVNPADVKFPIICSNDVKKRAGEVIQANLLELGINVELVTMDLATYLDVTAKGDYTGAIGGFTSSSMLGYVQGVYDSSSINASNKTRLNNPDVDALIAKASSTLDPTECAKVLEELCTLLNQVNSQVPLYQNMVIRAFNSGLDGVKVNAGGDLRFSDVYWK